MALALKIFAGFAVAAALSSSAHAQGLINEKNLSLGMGQAIANAPRQSAYPRIVDEQLREYEFQ